MPRIAHNTAHANANNNQQQTNLLTRIEENTRSIDLNVDTLEVNTDGLEGLITTTNTKLSGGLPSALTGSGRLKVESHITDHSTETKQDTVIGHLATVAGAVTGTEMQVDVLTMPTVAVTLSGGATEAKQDDGITHLATIAGDTTSINSKITACNTGAVTISSSALPSGAATQSTLNDAEVHLGNIETSVQLIDDAIVTDDSAVTLGSQKGVAIMGFAGTQSVNANDACMLACSTAGRLEVDVKNEVEVTNPGSFTVQEDGDALTALQLIDDVVVIDDAAVTLGSQKGVAIMGFAGTQSVNANDAAMLACSTAGRLEVDVKNTVSTAVTNTTLTNLNNCIDSNELQVDIVSSALPSGAATESSLSSIDGKVTACNTGAVTVSASALPSGAATESSLSSVDGKITQGNDATLTNAQQVLIYGKNGTGDLKPIHITNNGDVEVEIADFVKGQAAMAASFPVTIASNQSNLNVNQNIAGTDVDSNSGNKSAATQRVVIADDDVNLSAIKTAVELLDDAIGTDGSTGPGKCISIGGTESGGNIQELLVDSAGHLQIDVLSAPSTAVTNTTLTNLNNCIDSNELQVDIVASALPSGAATASLQGAGLPSALSLDNLKVSLKETITVPVSNVKTTGEWLATSTVIGDDNYSASLDCSSFREVRVFGKNASSLGPASIDVMGSQSDLGTYYKIGEITRETIEIGGTPELHYEGQINMPTNFIKLYNNSGSGTTLELDYVGFSV